MLSGFINFTPDDNMHQQATDGRLQSNSYPLLELFQLSSTPA